MQESDISFIEDLFKNEHLTKSRRTIGMLLRMAEIVKDPNAHPEAKKQAMANIQLMNQGFEPKLIRAPRPPKKPKKDISASPQTSTKEAFQALVKPPASPLEYHPDLGMHGVTPEMYEQASPEHRKIFHDYHSEVMGGKHPAEYQKLVAAGKIKVPKVEKSLEKLKSLFKALREHLPQDN